MYKAGHGETHNFDAHTHTDRKMFIREKWYMPIFGISWLILYIDKLCLRFQYGVVLLMPLFPRFHDGVVLMMPNINQVIVDDVLVLINPSDHNKPCQTFLPPLWKSLTVYAQPAVCLGMFSKHIKLKLCHSFVYFLFHTKQDVNVHNNPICL